MKVDRLIHMRGDVTGLLLFFTLLFLGIWQLVVTWKRLNGFSVTGYPDRRKLSFAIGLAVIAGACVWYYSRPGHFASPDVEGFETILLLAVGFLAATAIQGLLASVAFRRVYREGRSLRGEEVKQRPEEVTLSVEGTPVPASFGLPIGGEPVPGVLLLHDYGGDRRDLRAVAERLRSSGHPTLSVDLDGHGENPRGVSSPAMESLLGESVSFLRKRAGQETVFAVGVGLGGSLAIRLAAAHASVVRAVAVDPPACEPGGYPAVNAGRELKPHHLAAAFRRPPARSRDRGSISLSRMLRLMPPAGAGALEGVTVIGTAKTWFNSPATLRGYLAGRGIGEPALIDGGHSCIASREETLDSIEKALR